MDQVNDTSSFPRQDWFNIKELESAYGKTGAYIRSQLKQALEIQKGEKDTSKFLKGAGPHGGKYHILLVEKVLGKIPPVGSKMGGDPLPFKSFGRSAAVKLIGPDAMEFSPQIALLQSRQQSKDTYESFMTKMIETGKDLRIRCMTGTDFFNAHFLAARAFWSRAENNLV